MNGAMLLGRESNKMETLMSRCTVSWRQLAAVGVISLLAACAQSAPQTVGSNPPPVAPGATAVWHTVDFDTNSFAINANGQKVIADVTSFLQQHPASVATLIGRTDTVGTADANMRLSQRRADAVRDALVDDGHVALDRVETRWTGERRKGVPTGDEVAAAENRVVDIAIH
jgi:OOP family OmpA-OmpF porin